MGRTDWSTYDDPDRPRRTLLKHFSLDHKFVIIDNEDRWIENAYRDEDGNLHLRIGGC